MKNKNKDTTNKTEEPSVAFKNVHIFNSLEEAAEFETKQRAGLSYDKRLLHVEELRKMVFHQYLLPDGRWPSLSKAFQIKKLHNHDSGQ
ncbi:MAG: hypothetical protein EA359_07845 [Balneolaceae bacterium]|nr:MAG: hypothetical protein EA359_07845 [Balneolaceae bacterium]